MLDIGHGCRSDDQAVNPLTEKHLDSGLLPADLFPGIGQDNVEPCGARHLADATDGLSEIRVLDVTDDNTDCSRAARRHAAGEFIRLIAQNTRRIKNLFLYL